MNSVKILTIEKLDEMFKKYPLYSQDSVKDKKVILEVFIPYQNMYWLLLEGSREDDDFIFFGYCHITDSEFGYVSFNELYNLGYDLRFNYYENPISLNKLKSKYDIDK